MNIRSSRDVLGYQFALAPHIHARDRQDSFSDLTNNSRDVLGYQYLCDAVELQCDEQALYMTQQCLQ